MNLTGGVRLRHDPRKREHGCLLRRSPCHGGKVGLPGKSTLMNHLLGLLRNPGGHRHVQGDRYLGVAGTSGQGKGQECGRGCSSPEPFSAVTPRWRTSCCPSGVHPAHRLRKDA
ncbi:MAG: hypothetical protein MZV64_37125 [Ignavibacteriales bacterium]|nr:hypothetical protein [Ignavibacteriales bacterium]